jgi:hypothetical protein
MTSATQAHFQPRPAEERLIRFAAVLLGIALAVATSAGLAGQVDRLGQPAGDAGISLGAAADTSYDQVEKARAGFSLGAAADTSYDQVEKARAARN